MPPSTSPCSALYDDVLREIFITCCIYGDKKLTVPPVVGGGYKRSICDVPQLRVSRVCRSWRHVALCIPQLWDNIMIQEITKTNLSLAREYLSRAGSAPVSIELDQPQNAPWKAFYSNLTDFLSSYRLRSLTTRLAFFNLILPDLSQRSVADLETLIIFNYHASKEGSINLNDIRYPKLTVFRIWGVHKLSVFSSSLRIFDGEKLSMAVIESWDFLSHCPSLEEASFYLANITQRPDSVPLIRLQHLHFLNLTANWAREEIPFSTFIEALALPVIEKLWVHTGWMVWSSTAFQSLASRSDYFPYLSDIKFRNPTSVVDTSALLASMPSLKSMSLCWSYHNNNVVFDHLVLNGLATGSLVPQLHSLVVGCISNEGEFLDMVESRMKNAQMSSNVVPAPFTKVKYWIVDGGAARLRNMQQQSIPIEATLVFDNPKLMHL